MGRKKSYSDEELMILINSGTSKADCARQLGVDLRGVRRRLAAIRDKEKAEEFEMSEIPKETRSLSELLEAKKVVFKRRRDHFKAKNLVDINIKLDGPIAISCFGDPHLDDDGCDIKLVEKHMNIVKNTKGMFAINIGDITNNWVGRLQHKYAEQTTKLSEAWVLAEWMIEGLPWLAIIAGNHDVWHDGHDPLQWIASHANQPYINHGVRMKVNFPNGKHITVNAAHNFPGHSQFNPVHGAMKKAMRFADDLNFCGHLHNTGLGVVIDPATGKVCYAIRCDSYKRFDEFCDKIGIDDVFVSPCVTAVINPYNTTNRDKIVIFFSVEQASDYLTFLRTRFEG